MAQKFGDLTYFFNLLKYISLTSSGKNVDGFSICHADDLVRLEPGAVNRPVDHVVKQERAETGLVLHQFCQLKDGEVGKSLVRRGKYCPRTSCKQARIRSLATEF